jgi:SAM-dependent methyltransferase
MNLEDHYTALYKQFGDDPRAVQLADALTQRRRFHELVRPIADIERASVLDVGCGLAHLYPFLLERGFAGTYSGIDINHAFIGACREKIPESRFEVHDIAAAPPAWHADYTLLNGVFNNPRENPWGFLEASLRNMFAVSDRAMVFNAMSSYVDFFADDLVYFDPSEVFRFCKEELSPLVELQHAYQVRAGGVPFEFVVVVHRTTVAPRKLRAANAGPAR